LTKNFWSGGLCDAKVRAPTFLGFFLLFLRRKEAKDLFEPFYRGGLCLCPSFLEKSSLGFFKVESGRTAIGSRPLSFLFEMFSVHSAPYYVHSSTVGAERSSFCSVYGGRPMVAPTVGEGICATHRTYGGAQIDCRGDLWSPAKFLLKVSLCLIRKTPYVGFPLCSRVSTFTFPAFLNAWGVSPVATGDKGSAP